MPTAYVENPHFNQWLATVKDEPKFRSLIAFVVRDRGCWPERPVQLATLLRHLREHEGEAKLPSEKVVREAFAAYRRFISHGGKIPRRYGPEPMPAGKRRVTKSYMVAPDTAKKIERLKRATKSASYGQVLDDAIALYYAHVHEA